MSYLASGLPYPRPPPTAVWFPLFVTPPGSPHRSLAVLYLLTHALVAQAYSSSLDTRSGA
jgi:hypothetical protein